MSKQTNKTDADTTNIALAKGRILQSALPVFGAAGMGVAPQDLDSRRLIVGTESPDVRMTIVRSSDVLTYVEHGAADLGIVGKDMLMEYEGNNIYEVLDLGISCCRLVIAGCSPQSLQGSHLRVATKYVKSAARYFAAAGKQAEIIRLYGSMELAPLTGLADIIIDLVDTGNTLKANGLHEIEEIAPISARLVASKAAMKMRSTQLEEVIGRIRNAVEVEEVL